MDKSKEDFKRSLRLLQQFIIAVKEGKKEFYVPISCELRKLFTDDNSKRPALIYRAIPDLKLPKLEIAEFVELFGDEWELGVAAPTKFDGKGGYELTLARARSGIMLPVREWLEQPIVLLGGKLSIRQLIKSVANKEGCHSDLTFDQWGEKLRNIKIVSDDMHIPLLVALVVLLFQSLAGQKFIVRKTGQPF